MLKMYKKESKFTKLYTVVIKHHKALYAGIHDGIRKRYNLILLQIIF